MTRRVLTAEVTESREARLGPNTAVGDRELCAWQPVKGVVWVQTRAPEHARRMAQRQDSRLVVVGMAGGYLKTFEFRRSLAWAVRLMKRYKAGETATNAGLDGAVCPPAKGAGRSGRGQPAGLGTRLGDFRRVKTTFGGREAA